MLTFVEMEERLARLHVRAPHYGASHGLIALDGEDSEIRLTGNIPGGGSSTTGWFDLRLVDPDGGEVFVHNALRSGLRFPSGTPDRTATIFPNFVVHGEGGVDGDGRCRRISFMFDGLEDFFDYGFLGWHHLDDDGASAFSRLVGRDGSASRADAPFAPRSVVYANAVGTLLDFEVDGSRYSVEGRTLHAPGRSRHECRVELAASIVFPEPRTLEEATDACWAWRSFFVQAAMRVLPFTAFEVGATAGVRSGGALYMPLERAARRPAATGLASPLPLCRREDRDELAAAMMDWLSKEGRRRYFRASLERVIARPGHVAIEDAVALCGGIETLEELAEGGRLPSGVVGDMADAAVAAAAARDCPVDAERVRGVLGLLQQEGLGRRLRRLAEFAAPETDRGEVENWIRVVTSLRLYGAHGRPPKRPGELVGGPAVDALAALCVRFDLQGSGVPDGHAGGMPFPARRDWERALLSLRLCQEEPEG